jgi:hypothetical protein
VLGLVWGLLTLAWGIQRSILFSDDLRRKPEDWTSTKYFDPTLSAEEMAYEGVLAAAIIAGAASMMLFPALVSSWRTANPFSSVELQTGLLAVALLVGQAQPAMISGYKAEHLALFCKRAHLLLSQATARPACA